MNNQFSWKDAFPSTLATLLFITQMIYGFLYVTNDRVDSLQFIGISIFLLSGYFGMAPVFLFKRRGKVPKGKQYMHTTKLVDTGLYAIIRHPQYCAFILWAFGAMFLFQNLVIILLGLPVIVLTYFDMIRADHMLYTKFGLQYKEYMKKVPRANFLWGILRLLHRNYSK